ncbi:MAG: cupin domain-containing protein [Bacteroidia bacterium]
MPTKGQVVSNPHTGDSFEFLETAKDTNGARVTLKSTIKSKGELVPNHFHVLQDEVFEVQSGKLTVLADGKVQVVAAGEKIVLPKGKRHNHYNNHDEPVVYIHTTSPALDFDYFIENLTNYFADHKITNGKAGLVQELVTLKYMDSKAFLADVPVGIQKVLMNTVAPVARLFGYRAFHKKYCGIEK